MANVSGYLTRKIARQAAHKVKIAHLNGATYLAASGDPQSALWERFLGCFGGAPGTRKRGGVGMKTKRASVGKSKTRLAAPHKTARHRKSA